MRKVIVASVIAPVGALCLPITFLALQSIDYHLEAIDWGIADDAAMRMSGLLVQIVGILYLAFVVYFVVISSIRNLLRSQMWWHLPLAGGISIISYLVVCFWAFKGLVFDVGGVVLFGVIYFFSLLATALWYFLLRNSKKSIL